MSYGFEHKDLIKSLKNNFTQYFNEYLGLGSFIKVFWEFPEKDFEHAYISGYGNEEVKIIKTLFNGAIMRTNDKLIFEKAFNELSEEGYFGDFVAKANQLPPTTKADSKANSTLVAEQKTHYGKEKLTVGK